MNYEVPISSIVCMGISCLVGLAIPVLLFLYFRLKKRADIVPFFVGCAVMLLFALVAESLVHALVLNSAAGKTITGSTALYALYGGLMAGIFEETGRFAAFKTVLKKYRGRNINALMYGAGHGGFEAAAILSAGMMSNIVLSVMLNLGMGHLITDELSGKQLEQITAAFKTLAETAPYMYLAGIAERIIAVILHIALSVIVWFAAKDRKKLWLFPTAVLLHAGVDAATAVLSRMGLNTWAIEGALAAMTAVCALIAWLIWKHEIGKEDDMESTAEVSENTEA